MPKKEGWMQKKMREAQELASAQGRTVPGKQYENTSKSKFVTLEQAKLDLEYTDQVDTKDACPCRR